MTVVESIITRVESTKDNPGWVIYFNDNKYFLRIRAKYQAQPKVGDRVKVYGFPQTRGLEINDKVIFMHEHEHMSRYYAIMDKSVNQCIEIEKIISKMPKKKIKIKA